MFPEIPVSFTPRQLQPHGKGLPGIQWETAWVPQPVQTLCKTKKFLPLPVLEHHFPGHPGVQFGQYTTIQ